MDRAYALASLAVAGVEWDHAATVSKSL